MLRGLDVVPEQSQGVGEGPMMVRPEVGTIHLKDINTRLQQHRHRTTKMMNRQIKYMQKLKNE
jgi:hypothetical protein